MGRLWNRPKLKLRLDQLAKLTDCCFMAELDSIVQPVNAPATPVPQSPAPAPTPEPAVEPEPEAGQDIPEELLQIPAFQAVVAGSPPAISIKLANVGNREEIQLIAKNKDTLLNSGFAFYRSLSGELGVLFNETKISGEDIKAADKAGKLRMVAPDFDLVNHEVAKLGPDHPVFAAVPNSGGAAPPVSSASVPQAASGRLPLNPPPPASVQRRYAQQRMKNLQAGPPSTGPAPGAGRILNQILKPVV
jgi:hypothetical protein